MPYKDFTDRTWKVKESHTSCAVGSIVLITGPEENVTVRCGGETYKPGQYHPQGGGNGERIARGAEYTIQLIPVEPKYKLQATFTGLVGGSWTAEDNTGGDEGE